MRKASIFFLFLGVFAVCAGYADAQGRNGITGFVFDESRRPVPDVYVELQTESYATYGRARTQGSGMFSFRGLPDGQYYVRVLPAGTNFEEQSKMVSLLPLSLARGRGAVLEQVDFYLRPKRRRDEPTSPPAVIFAQEIPADAKSIYEEGLSDLANNNEQQGLDKVKRSIEIFPDYYDALDRLGNEYVNRGHYEAAYALLGKALMVNPRSFSSTLAVGVAEFRLNQNKQAVDRFRQAVSLSKESANAHLWLGIAFHSVGELNKSLDALKQANELSSGTSPDVHWQLARVHKDKKNYTEAADELELFLKYRPDAPNSKEIRQVIVTLRQKK